MSTVRTSFYAASPARSVDRTSELNALNRLLQMTWESIYTQIYVYGIYAMI